MKKQNLIISAMVVLLLIILPAFAQAANEPRLRLSVAQPDLGLNEQMTIDVLVEEAHSVYGTEIRLSFDPAKVEVVSLSHGNFLSADPDNQAFVLEKKADNQKGTIDYALSLLNPAPPAEGSGVLLQMTIQAKAAGPVVIEFENGLFGTQAGEEIIAITENVEFNIVPGSNSPAPVVEARPVAPPQNVSQVEADAATVLGLSLVVGGLLIFIVGLVGVALLIGVWFWLTRSKQKKRTQPAQPN